MNTEFYKMSGNADDDAALERAAAILRDGGLVAFPTETVYGLGASALSPTAAQRIYAAKGRPSDNPLIVHISSPEQAERLAYTTPLYYELARRFMPGPLTIILPKRDCVPSEVTGGLQTVALRCPENLIARRLIEATDLPIAAPSANLSGKPSPTSAAHVLGDMDGRIEMIIDGGECDIGVESTVITLAASDGVCTVLRPGAVTEDELAEVCGSVRVDRAVCTPSLAGDHPGSPGMKYKHYSPNANVILVEANDESFAEYVNSHAAEHDAVFASRADSARFTCRVLITGERGTASEQNHSLYSLLRYADELSLENVYIKCPERDGEQLALFNRLIRAAAGKITRP